MSLHVFDENVQDFVANTYSFAENDGLGKVNSFLQLMLFLHPRKGIVTGENSPAGTSQGYPRRTLAKHPRARCHDAM